MPPFVGSPIPVGAAVRPPDELTAFDPATGSVTGRIPLPGCHGAHGVYVDPLSYLGPVSLATFVRLAPFP